jgi:hypothetical protein
MKVPEEEPAEVQSAEHVETVRYAPDPVVEPDETERVPLATLQSSHELAPIETHAAPALVAPKVGRVARRALVLAAVAARGLLEQQDHADPDIEAQRQRLAQWLDGLDVGDEPESEEWHILQCPVGTLEHYATVEAVWRFESLVVLVWALGLTDLPAHDRLVDPSALLPCVGFLSHSGAQNFLATAALRPVQEINGFAHIAYAVHWRLHEFALRPARIDFAAVAKSTWFGPLDQAHIRLLDGDLALGEHTLSAAPQEAVATALSTAQERHQAANWLCGFSPIYSQTDTTT